MEDRDCQELRNDLTWLEGSLLAAMRTWVLACKRGVPSAAPVEGLFANLRASGAAEHLDGLMRALNQGCTRMINVWCTCEPVLSADEIRLLDMLALLQQGRHEAAAALLRDFVDPATAHAATAHALAILQLLHQAGHRLPRRSGALRRLGRAGRDSDESLAETPGSGVLVH